MIPRLLLLLLALIQSMAAYAGPRDAPALRILFIGNSYTYYNDMPQLLRKMANASGATPRLEVEAVTVGGATLADHWNGSKARAAFARKKWDYVILQEQSTLPITDPASMHAYVRLFDREIRAAGAKTMLFLTWARSTAPETQDALDTAYLDIGAALGAVVAPVGPAWAIARREHPAIPLYDDDHSHPKIAGSYLAACVFHFMLFKRAPGDSGIAAGLRQDERRALIDAARKAVLRHGGLAGAQAWRAPDEPGVELRSVALSAPSGSINDS